MTVTVNAGRGGVVLEDASTVAPDVSGATGVPVVCEAVGCATCEGDYDGNGTVTFQDLVNALTAMDIRAYADILETDPDYNACADWDGNGTWTFQDLVNFLTAMDIIGYADQPCPW